METRIKQENKVSNITVSKLPSVPFSIDTTLLHNNCLLTDFQIEFIKKQYEKGIFKEQLNLQPHITSLPSTPVVKSSEEIKSSLRTQSVNDIKSKYKGTNEQSSTNSTRSNLKAASLLRNLSQKSLEKFANDNAYSQDIAWLSSRILKDQPKTSKLYSPHTVMIVIDPETNQARFFALGLGEKSGRSQNIGSGSFGTVKVVQDLDSKKWYALKIADAPKPAPRRYDYQDMRNEAIKLSKIGVPAIFLKKEKIKNPATQAPASKKGLILMEYIDGTPMSKLDKLERPDIWWLGLSIDTLTSLSNLHASHIIHRDIKEDNLMVSPLRKKKCKTLTQPIDVGHSNILKEENLRTFSIESFNFGSTPAYRAPELKKSNHIFTAVIFNEKTEVYAAGITIMRTLKLGETKLYDEENPEDKLKLENSKIKNPELRKTIISYLNHFMLNQDPDQRPTMKKAIDSFNEILNNYIKEYPEALTKKIGLLDISEYLKLSAENKKKMIEALKSFDEVCTIDQHKKQGKHNNYVKYRRELLSEGVMLSKKVFSSESKMKKIDFINDIPLFEKTTENCIYTHITTHKSIHTLAKNQNVVRTCLVKKEKPSSLATNISRLFTRNSIDRFSLPALQRSLKRRSSNKSEISTDESENKQLSLSPQIKRKSGSRC